MSESARNPELPGSAEELQVHGEAGGFDVGGNGQGTACPELYQDPVSVRVDTTWEKLRPYVDYIYSENPRFVGGVEVYGLVGKTLMICTSDSERFDGMASRRALDRLLNHVREHLKVIFAGRQLESVGDAAAADDALISELREKLRAVDACSKRLSRHFHFVNDVARALDVRDEDGELLDVCDTAMSCWRRVVLEPRMDDVVAALLRRVDRRRSGELVDLLAVVELVCGLRGTRLGVVVRGRAPTAFDALFKKVYLEKVEADCRPIVRKLVGDFAFARYLEGFGTVFAGEKELLEMSTDGFSHVSLYDLRAQLERIFFSDQEEFLRRETAKVLVAVRRADLAPVSPERVIDEVISAFCAAVMKDGEAAWRKCGADADADPVALLSAVADAVTKHKPYADNPSRNRLDPLSIVTVWRHACEKLFETVGDAAQVIAEGCVSVVRKFGKKYDAVEVGRELGPVLAVLPFLADVKEFENRFLDVLKPRLLNCAVVSNEEDIVTCVVEKLLDVLGPHRAKKFSLVLDDVATSRAFDEKYREHLSRGDDPSRPQVDFTVRIVASGLWTFEISPEIRLPHELGVCAQGFAAFYASSFENTYDKKQLVWLHEASRGELLSNGFGRPYTFSASTLQMSVLLTFNNGDAVTFAALKDVGGMSDAVLTSTVASLVKAGLVQIDGKGDLTEVRLNVNFYSEKCRVDLA